MKLTLTTDDGEPLATWIVGYERMPKAPDYYLLSFQMARQMLIDEIRGECKVQEGKES